MKIIFFKKACSACSSNCSLTFLELLKQVLKDLNIEASIEIKNGLEEAAKFGGGEVPSLMINDKLVASGFYLTEKQLTKTIKKMGQ